MLWRIERVSCSVKTTREAQDLAATLTLFKLVSSAASSDMRNGVANSAHYGRLPRDPPHYLRVPIHIIHKLALPGLRDPCSSVLRLPYRILELSCLMLFPTVHPQPV